MKPIQYPFKAKSTAYLLPGQFWAIKLNDPGYFDHPGWYGCGRVLQAVKGSRRYLLAGLMGWVDTRPPTSESIAGHKLIDQVICHVEGIELNILGHRSLQEDGLEPLLWLDARDGNYHNPNKRPSLMKGLDMLREATAREYHQLREQDLVQCWGSIGVGYRSKDTLERLIAEKTRGAV